MLIVLVTHYFSPEAGAPQRRWSALTARFAQMGHRVAVFAPAPHYPSGVVPREYRKLLRAGTTQRLNDDVVVHRVGHFPHRGDIATRSLDHLWTALSTIGMVHRLHRRSAFSPDIVIATAPAIESLIAGRVIAKRLGIPLVAEMRDAWPDLVAFTPGLVKGGSPVTLLKQWVHRAVTALQARAAAVITTTEAFAEVLRTRGIQHVEVLRNGTTHTEYEPVGASARDTGPLRLLYMGTIGRSQGLDRVLTAVARLRAAGVDIECRIVGQGADRIRLERLNQALRLPVELIDAVDPSEVRAHYLWADSTIVSLRDWEPFAWTVPSKLYELLATGKHITAIVAGEAAQIVHATAAGNVVAPGDIEGLVELWERLANERESLRVDSRGRTWVEQYADYDALADRYLEILNDVHSRARGA